MKELKDYTDDEIIEEYHRRKALKAKGKRVLPKPKYEIKTGTVDKVFEHNSFTKNSYIINFNDKTLPTYIQTSSYKLKIGDFTKSTAPKVGDKVVLKCLITKASPMFNAARARIINTNKSK